MSQNLIASASRDRLYFWLHRRVRKPGTMKCTEAADRGKLTSQFARGGCDDFERSSQQGRYTTSMTDENAIRELQRKWFQATMNGDIATISELMTDDVVFLTPGRDPFGRNAFLESFTSMKEHVTIECGGEYLEIIVDGDLAVATTRLNIKVTPKNGNAAKHLAGNTLSVFARQADGRWTLSRDANLLTPKST